MDKYLVFRLEKGVYPHPNDQSRLISACFELVMEWEANKIGLVDVEGFAKSYSEAYGLRTLVLKGSVFG